MKNIEIIDDALNCKYEIYAASDEDFDVIFPKGQDIEFSDDLFDRLGEDEALKLTRRLWKNRVERTEVRGIHGILFYGEDNFEKKTTFPSKRLDEDCFP
jgi:hypothetical protein